MKKTPKSLSMPVSRNFSISPIAWAALSYFCAALATQFLNRPIAVANPFWPAAGFSVFFAIRFGYTSLIGTFLGSFAAAMVYDNTSDDLASRVLAASTLAIASTIRATVGRLILGPTLSLRVLLSDFKTKYVFRLIGISILLGSVGAFVGLFCPSLVNADMNPLAQDYVRWVIGDVGGVLTITPLLLAAPWHRVETNKSLKFTVLNAWSSIGASERKRVRLYAAWGVILSTLVFFSWHSWPVFFGLQEFQDVIAILWSPAVSLLALLGIMKTSFSVRPLFGLFLTALICWSSTIGFATSQIAFSFEDLRIAESVQRLPSDKVSFFYWFQITTALTGLFAVNAAERLRGAENKSKLILDMLGIGVAEADNAGEPTSTDEIAKSLLCTQSDAEGQTSDIGWVSALADDAQAIARSRWLQFVKESSVNGGRFEDLRLLRRGEFGAQTHLIQIIARRTDGLDSDGFLVGIVDLQRAISPSILGLIQSFLHQTKEDLPELFRIAKDLRNTNEMDSVQTLSQDLNKRLEHLEECRLQVYCVLPLLTGVDFGLRRVKLVEEFQRIARQIGIDPNRIEFKGKGAPPEPMLPYHVFEIVTNNLLVNAITHGGRDATIEVDWHQSKEPNEQGVLRFKVKDSGPGMSKQKKDDIEKRLHSFLPDDIGLKSGLWIASQALKAIGSELHIQGKLNNSFRFKLRMGTDPYVRRHDGGVTSPVTLGQAQAVNFADFGGFILIDDQWEHRAYVASNLLRSRCRRLAVLPGKVDAMQFVENSIRDKDHDFSVALVDMVLGDGSGDSVAAALRNADKSGNLKIVFISSTVDPDSVDGRRLVKSGVCDAWIPKFEDAFCAQLYGVLVTQNVGSNMEKVDVITLEKQDRLSLAAEGILDLCMELGDALSVTAGKNRQPLHLALKAIVELHPGSSETRGDLDRIKSYVTGFSSQKSDDKLDYFRQYVAFVCDLVRAENRGIAE